MEIFIDFNSTIFLFLLLKQKKKRHIMRKYEIFRYGKMMVSIVIRYNFQKKYYVIGYTVSFSKIKRYHIAIAPRGKQITFIYFPIVYLSFKVDCK